jgi:predicted CXXCH cytochrome family protein
MLAGFAAGQAGAAGIADTKHNLSTTNTRATDNRVSAGTEEICVFCHTPHGADVTVPAPLWNKRLPAATGYTTYASLNSSTIDGAFTTTVGGVSLACLSCHDGTQAMDNIINAPGPGGLDPTGGGALGRAYTWVSGTPGPRVDADGRLIGTNNAALLGTDLSNDHPIGIQYCGGGPISTAAAAACRDTDFVAPQNATINGNLVWWVDTPTGTPGTRQRTDVILYTRDFTLSGGGGTVTGPSVECGSCHDPHVPAASPTQVAFLRVNNTGSALCLACHVK